MLPVGEGVCNMPSSTACDEESELGNNSVWWKIECAYLHL